MPAKSPVEKVLLVDRELLTRDLLGNHLKHMGFKVFAVESTPAALKIIPQSQFRLAVVSEKVGEECLADIVRKLRACEVDSLVFLTVESVRDADSLERMDVFDTFVKPFRLEEVTVKVRHAVENISLRRALRTSAEQVRRLENELSAYDTAGEEVRIPDLEELKSGESPESPKRQSPEADSPQPEDRAEGPTDDVFDKIGKLDILRRNGILTNSEFSRKKKELLDRI